VSMAGRWRVVVRLLRGVSSGGTSRSSGSWTAPSEVLSVLRGTSSVLPHRVRSGRVVWWCERTQLSCFTLWFSQRVVSRLSSFYFLRLARGKGHVHICSCLPYGFTGWMVHGMLEVAGR
jgi:hypothetical protein